MLYYYGDNMKTFKDKIIDYEQKYEDLTYIARSGDIPVILTAVHTMVQTKENGELKNSEPYTKAIAMCVAEEANCFFLIKNKDTGVDPNNTEDDIFKICC